MTASENLGQQPATQEKAGSQKKSSKQRRKEYPPAPEPLPVAVVDNHAHLSFRDGLQSRSVAQQLDDAAAVGVRGAVLVGFDVASSEFAVVEAHADSRAKAAVALHPNDVPELQAAGEYQAAFARICELAEDPAVVAVGETGLDYFRTEEEEGRAGQLQGFRDHLELAVARGLAMQIHDRDAHADVVQTLRDAAELPPAVVFHCFSGDAELARICNDNGWYMSFAGTVTFGNAPELREALAIADPQLILVETDTPFLTPHPHRGQPNAPYMIPQTLRLMAKVRQQSVEALGAQVMANTSVVYGPWS